MYAHNITDVMDDKIVTHFMQLNAEWSFYGSLVIFSQERQEKNASENVVCWSHLLQIIS